MIGWILRAFAVGVLFLAFHGVLTLAGAGVPWWGSALAAAATYLMASFALKRLFLRAVTAPFKAKGAPLRGARLVVHSVTAVAAPVRQRQPALAMAGGGGDCDDEGENDGDCGESHDDAPDTWRWYCVDATIAPTTSSDGPFRCWAPCDLGVESVHADTSPEAPTDDGMASIKSVEIFEDGAFVKDEGMSFEGERRLRITMACAPELTVAKLRYYFEGFGSIELPQD